MRPSFDAAMDGLEDARNERDQALAALRELVEAFDHWRATTVGFAGGNDTAERFAALEAEIESARDLLERLS